MKWACVGEIQGGLLMRNGSVWDSILLSLNMKSSKNKKTVIFLNKKEKRL